MSGKKDASFGVAPKEKTGLCDGYYLSVYSCVHPFCHLMGESYRHDHNLALWDKKGEKIALLHHWELERITGIKHHNVSFFDENDFEIFVNDLLQPYQLTLQDMQAVFGTPAVSRGRACVKSADLQDFSYHTIAHLFSSLCMDSEAFYHEDILALSLDGGSDILLEDARQLHMYMGAYSHKGSVTFFPVPSPSIYWDEARNTFDLEPGTLMALAYASESRSLELDGKTEPLIPVFGDDERTKIIRYIDHLKARIFSYTTEDAGTLFNGWDPRFTQQENKLSMIMKILQEITIRQTEQIVEEAISRFSIQPQTTYLAISGGYALNCPTNTHLMKKYGFKAQKIVPCANDGGQAVGWGLYYFYTHMDRFDFQFTHPYYGDADDGFEAFLRDDRFQPYIADVYNGLKLFVEDIVQAPIVWFDGRAESGPRALGHRSILADPRTDRSRELLNHYKQRQWWRPVAPLILEECRNDWFAEAFPSPYMLNNFSILPSKSAQVPAILHLDNTCRIQSVGARDDPRLYDILCRFHAATGVPLLCNTSLNDRGEPIVNTIPEAVNFALRKGIRVVYINGHRLLLKNHERFPEKAPHARRETFFKGRSADPALQRQYNPFGLSANEFFFYHSHPELSHLRLDHPEDVKKIRRLYKALIALYPNIYKYRNS